MTLRVKLFILLALAGIVPLAYSSTAGPLGIASFLWQVFKVSGTLTAIVLVYTFYGWRVPILSLCASAPNIRGTWRVESGSVHDVAHPNRTEIVPEAYLVLRQSDSQIRLHVLWDDGTDQVDELTADTPAISHQGKYVFAGTYVSQPKATEHAVGAYIQYSEQAPETFTLRYRTDDGFTGELNATGRRPWHFANLSKAKAGHQRKVGWILRIGFALKHR